MFKETRSILLDGPIDYLIFSRGKVHMRNNGHELPVPGNIIEREDDTILVRLSRNMLNNKRFVDNDEKVTVSTAYRSQELVFETTPVPCFEEGILKLRIPNLGVLRNKRIDSRHPFEFDGELRATLHITTSTSEFVLTTSKLVNFSANTIAFEVDRNQGLALPCDKVTRVTIHSEGEVIFENEGQVLRVDMNYGDARGQDRYLLIISLWVPYSNRVKEVGDNRRRSDRTVLIHENSAFVQFCHPFLGSQLLTYNIVDISNSGLSFAMGDQALPMPEGLMVRNVSVQLPRKPRLEVSFVVSYVEHLDPCQEQAGFVQRIGVRLVDVTTEILKEVTNFIQKENSEFLTDASYDDYHRLWEFYFETSFIYGSKRKQIQRFSEKVFDTDRKLMQSNSPLIKKILHKQGGEIKGHLTTIKIFDHTLIIQHLNASKASGASAGQSVIRAMTTYFLDHYANQQAENRYVCAYYRPENKYPDLVFGKTALLVNDPQICWTRQYKFCLPNAEPFQARANVTCREATEEDLKDLEILLIEQGELALMRVEGLYRETMQHLQLSKEYEKIGLYRYRKVFVARNSVNQTAAYAVCTYTSPGVNLSELTNSVKFVYQSTVDEAGNQDLADALGRIVHESYSETDMTDCVLLLSEDQPVPAGFKNAKSYVWWVLDLAYVDKFREATEHIFLNLKEYIRSRKKTEKDINAG